MIKQDTNPLLNSDSDLIFLYYLEEYRRIKLSRKDPDGILVLVDLLLPYAIPAWTFFFITKSNAVDIGFLIWALTSMCIGFLANYIMAICGYEGLFYRSFSKTFKINKKMKNTIYKGNLKNIFCCTSKNLADSLHLKHSNMKNDIKKYGGVKWDTVKEVIDASVI